MEAFFIYSLGGLIFTYLIVALLLWLKDRANTYSKIRQKLNDRVWDIPVTLQCQACKEVVEIDFSLETTNFECPHCKNKNKVMIQFLTVAEDTTWNQEQ